MEQEPQRMAVAGKRQDSLMKVLLPELPGTARTNAVHVTVLDGNGDSKATILI